MRFILALRTCYSFHMVKLVQALLLVVLMVSCGRASSESDAAIAAFAKVRSSIELGQSKAKVLALVSPTQESLRAESSMPPEKFRNEKGETVEIYFMRSRRQPDGLITYDEFTPLVFQSGVLTSIGWVALGGPPTSAQAKKTSIKF